MSPFPDIESSTYFDPVRNFKTSCKDIPALEFTSISSSIIMVLTTKFSNSRDSIKCKKL